MPLCGYCVEHMQTIASNFYTVKKVENRPLLRYRKNLQIQFLTSKTSIRSLFFKVKQGRKWSSKLRFNKGKTLFILAHFFPMFPFDPPENERKPKVFWRFQGDQKGTFGRNGLKVDNFLGINFHKFHKFSGQFPKTDIWKISFSGLTHQN